MGTIGEDFLVKCGDDIIPFLPPPAGYLSEKFPALLFRVVSHTLASFCVCTLDTAQPRLAHWYRLQAESRAVSGAVMPMLLTSSCRCAQGQLSLTDVLLYALPVIPPRFVEVKDGPVVIVRDIVFGGCVRPGHGCGHFRIPLYVCLHPL